MPPRSRPGPAVRGLLLALLLAGCTADIPVAPESPIVAEQAPIPEASSTAAAQLVAGDLAVAIVGPPTLTPRGSRCLLEAPALYTFSGDLVGTAATTVRVDLAASCDDVAQNPPGTFADRFRARLDFDGEVAGQPSRVDILYLGRTEAGGAVTGRMILKGGPRGVLAVEGQAGVRGSYEGRVVR